MYMCVHTFTYICIITYNIFIYIPDVLDPPLVLFQWKNGTLGAGTYFCFLLTLAQ